MPEANLPLLQVQQLVADRLDGDAWFDLIPVVTENLGDIAKILEIAIGKLGCVVVVETVLGNTNHPNVPSLDLDEIPVTITVWENVLINRDANNPGASRKNALDTAQVIAALIHHYQPEGWNSFHLVSPTITRSDDPELVGYHVHARISCGYRYQATASLSTNSSETILTNAGVEIAIN